MLLLLLLSGIQCDTVITEKIRLISLSDEKKKTKVVDSEVNPVWNEVTNLLTVGQTHA